MLVRTVTNLNCFWRRHEGTCWLKCICASERDYLSMQFMLLVLGLNEANSNYACPFCTVHKDERYV